MDVKELSGKTVKRVNELLGGEVLEIIFTDETILRISVYGNGDGLDYEINPKC
jgi:hypothetical protein